MNFNVYINKQTGELVDKVAKQLHRSRNSIIKEALEEWLNKHTPSKWPEGFFDFSPIRDALDFKSYRNELSNNIPKDPLA